jgi:hypothetical protein
VIPDPGSGIDAGAVEPGKINVVKSDVILAVHMLTATSTVGTSTFTGALVL